MQYVGWYLCTSTFVQVAAQNIPNPHHTMYKHLSLYWAYKCNQG